MKKFVIIYKDDSEEKENCFIQKDNDFIKCDETFCDEVYTTILDNEAVEIINKEIVDNFKQTNLDNKNTISISDDDFSKMKGRYINFETPYVFTPYHVLLENIKQYKYNNSFNIYFYENILYMVILNKKNKIIYSNNIAITSINDIEEANFYNDNLNSLFHEIVSLELLDIVKTNLKLFEKQSNSFLIDAIQLFNTVSVLKYPDKTIEIVYTKIDLNENLLNLTQKEFNYRNLSYLFTDKVIVKKKKKKVKSKKKGTGKKKLIFIILNILFIVAYIYSPIVKNNIDPIVVPLIQQGKQYIINNNSINKFLINYFSIDINKTMKIDNNKIAKTIEQKSKVPEPKKMTTPKISNNSKTIEKKQIINKKVNNKPKVITTKKITTPKISNNSKTIEKKQIVEKKVSNKPKLPNIQKTFVLQDHTIINNKIIKNTKQLFNIIPYNMYLNSVQFEHDSSTLDINLLYQDSFIKDINKKLEKLYTSVKANRFNKVEYLYTTIITNKGLRSNIHEISTKTKKYKVKPILTSQDITTMLKQLFDYRCSIRSNNSNIYNIKVNVKNPKKFFTLIDNINKQDYHISLIYPITWKVNKKRLDISFDLKFDQNQNY